MKGEKPMSMVMWFILAMLGLLVLLLLSIFFFDKADFSLGQLGSMFKVFS